MTVRKISQNINEIEFKSLRHKIAKAVATDLKNSMHNHGKLGFPKVTLGHVNNLWLRPNVRSNLRMNDTWHVTYYCDNCCGFYDGKITS